MICECGARKSKKYIRAKEDPEVSDRRNPPDVSRYYYILIFSIRPNSVRRLGENSAIRDGIDEAR